MASGGVVLTEKHARTLGCICDIFQPSLIINPKWQFLGCASIAFSERHEETRELRRKMSVTFREIVWTDDKEERNLINRLLII
jgi:predicted phosphoribosyltransferase